jgi:hypothetical protein
VIVGFTNRTIELNSMSIPDGGGFQLYIMSRTNKTTSGIGSPGKLASTTNVCPLEDIDVIELLASRATFIHQQVIPDLLEPLKELAHPGSCTPSYTPDIPRWHYDK